MFNFVTLVFSLYFLNVTADYRIRITETADSDEMKPCPFNRHAESYFQVRQRKHFEIKVN